MNVYQITAYDNDGVVEEVREYRAEDVFKAIQEHTDYYYSVHPEVDPDDPPGYITCKQIS